MCPRHLLTTIALLAPLPVLAELDMPDTKVSMETCLQSALTAKPGEVRRLELEVEAGRPIYEFVIRTDSRQTWEIECDAMTGEIVEMSRDADRNDPEFKEAATLLETEARKAALAKYPGKVKDSELEIDRNGTALYEITVDGGDGREMEVKVDAASGEIVSAEDESDERTVYEIGAD